MEKIVGIGDMKMSTEAEDLLVTYSLGSCLGVAVYDPVVRVGGLIHMMLPKANMSSGKVVHNSFAFVDTGIPILFKLVYLAGAEKERLRVYVAGGASFRKDLHGVFAVGKRNLMELHEIVVKDGIEITGMEIGGHVARSMYLEIGTGRVWISTNGKTRDL